MYPFNIIFLCGLCVLCGSKSLPLRLPENGGGIAMEIRINGEKRTLDSPLTITGLLQSLDINPRSVVVERNLKIIPRSRMEREIVQDADSIEIIRLVGGG